MRRPGEYRNVLLLLSDNNETTSLLTQALAGIADVTTAWTVEEAFGSLQRSEFDSFLYDWDFAGADWREVCQQVQQGYPDLPIIVVCRYGGEGEWVEALKAGCFDLISPPYSDRYVLSVIEHAVASREAQACKSAA